ncbi:MAG TPA: Hsp33 family molecular chaperone HslO, partial [Polyangiaceae bacterium]|nr:Hsp33 family molecular chaperone HslO [Polyangiaceae bacterium]
LRDGALVAAGGLIVQLLPDAQGSAIGRMADRLEGGRALAGLLGSGGRLVELIAELLGEPIIELDERPVSFACRCDELRLIAALTTLPRADLEDLLRDQQVIEIGCDFCGKEFRIAPEKLRGLLQSS